MSQKEKGTTSQYFNHHGFGFGCQYLLPHVIEKHFATLCLHDDKALFDVPSQQCQQVIIEATVSSRRVT
jgi:hypothetical protein